MTNKQVDFKEVDVFTNVPYQGNPVAVVMNGDGLTDQQMHQIANWIHLSETTFVCQPTDPEADYQLRIFTPNNELPFAGHPTIGSAHAVLQGGLKPKHDGFLVQECKKGLVKIYKHGEELSFTLPEPERTVLSAEKNQLISAALDIPVTDFKISEKVDVGAVWYTIQVKDAHQVVTTSPDMKLLAELSEPGVSGVTIFGATSAGSDVKFEVRSFAPAEGADEDPVCGSGNGCVAALVKAEHLVDGDQYTAGQGQCLGRNGKVKVRITDGQPILVGGNAVVCIEGQIKRP
ncbi:PhzF family phenazine biosynthesis protein [Lactobacillus sp. Sy-1]|uniref:PhzF family phenazine biosynthesis protein n=1 Tax=Lactobacillus sp. Sy-1 TaxID=2109645 RepID=UPI001C5B90FF|nr:PhzF family phenazine biosynthesis protein [Lactobacillus sp. Sy-1]MBW1606398.1 PhzF family phenazine biosynthesis protein [Lactobacillus sp. Sy-1]